MPSKRDDAGHSETFAVLCALSRRHKQSCCSIVLIIPSVCFASCNPIYISVEDRGGRLRMLKYTPEHMHCIATFYGPITPPGTGILGYQVSHTHSLSVSQHTISISQTIGTTTKCQLVFASKINQIAATIPCPIFIRTHSFSQTKNLGREHRTEFSRLPVI